MLHKNERISPKSMYTLDPSIRPGQSGRVAKNSEIMSPGPAHPSSLPGIDLTSTGPS
jgi:hypothetical protein